MAETYMISLFFLPIFSLLLLFLNHFKTSFNSRKSPQLPPGPYPWPIIGNILQIGKDPHIILAKFAESYGPLISLRLGTQTMIVGSSPLAAMEILKTHDRILSARHVPDVVPVKRPERNYLSLGWALECNSQWNFLRTICKSKLFSVKAINSQASIREKKIREMVRHLNMMEGQVVEIGKIVFPTLFNTLGNIFMSRDFIRYGDESEDQGGMKGLMRRYFQVITVPNLSDFYPIFGGLDLQGLTKKCEEMTGRIWALWMPTIEERREKRSRVGYFPSQQEDFLDALLDNGFSDDQITQLFLELFTAGTDTGISTTEWVISELIRNPDSIKRAREELDEEIKDDFPNESHLPRLPYIQACVKEVLRLYPPTPILLTHRATESCEVMGYTIPKSSQVTLNFWAMGRDPKIWKDPLEFKPERFLNSELDFKGNDYEFLPFGSGRRICPGLPLAAKILPLMVASLIHLFDWSLPLGKSPAELDMNEEFGVTLQRKQPLLLIPKVVKK